jgi:hypothetical protein
MTSAAKKVLDDALALPEADLRRVAEALLDALPPESAEEIEQAWLEEARLRAGRLERGEVRSLDGETALQDIEAKLRTIRSK